MLCVTGNERSPDAWRQRAQSCDRRCRLASVAPPLHELRLDRLDRIDDDAFRLVGEYADRLIVCCRPLRQGGGFLGDEGERYNLLTRALAAGARWLDLEADVEPERIEALRSLAKTKSSELILSWHDFDRAGDDLAPRARRMAAHRPTAIKLAAMVEDASEVERIVSALDGLPVLRIPIAMGAAGLISRTHYAALGSAWSYVAATAESATAPGQLDLATALAMGMPASSCAPLTGLVGGPQVMHSPGPSIYNRLFRARGDPTSYLPIITRSLQRTLPLIERIGAIGLSVTMPLKGEALRFCQPDAIAREVGAVNSLRSRSGWQGTNTDVEGIRAPLVPLCATLALRRAVILGAGGAARAAAIACQRLGLGLEVCARRLEVVREFGASGQPIAWDDRTRVLPLRDAVLINVTPITGSDTPWPDEAALDAPVVFDTAIGSGRSRLLERARAAGAVTLDPLQMWLAQGAAQLSWFLDEPITVTDLELLAS